MMAGYVALNVEGFQFTGTPIRDESRVRQSVQSAVTGVTYCFYTNFVRNVQQQFDAWMSEFVAGREQFHLHSREETRRALAVYDRAPLQNKTSSGKGKKN